MRWLFFVAAVIGVGRTAAAEPTYPESEVDRPLLQYSGMTSLDLGLDLPTYAVTSVDASGNPTTTNTALGRYHNADVFVSHSFGNVELGGRLVGDPSGPYLQARFLTYLGPVPGALSVVAQLKAPSYNSVVDYEYTEGLGYTYKVAVAPHQLALFATASLDISELGLTPMAMSPPAPSAGTYVYGGVGFTAEAQITAPFAIALGAGVEGPIHQPGGAGSASFASSMHLLYVLGHWEFYCQLGLGDITSSRTPFVNFGAVHRWGG